MSGKAEKTDEQLAQEQALAQIRAVYEDGTAIVNGREYTFTKATHKKRLKVFSYFTGVREMMARQDFSFMGEESYEKIEQIVSELVTFEGTLLSKKPNHWNEFPQDYMVFMTTALGVISYPFLQGEK